MKNPQKITYLDPEIKQNVIWQPQPKQVAFMVRPEFECLYGGAAGGGKSDALVVEALRQVHIPYYKGLILRKTYPQLTELIDKSLLIYPRAVPGARYNSTTHTWTFPSGARIRFGSLNHSNDKFNYQGQAFDYIAFDELTQFEFDEYMYLISRCRPNGPGTRCYARATANPGGKGHGWVKARFITAAPPMTPITEEVTVEDTNGNMITIKRSRIFVPATVFDNQELLNNDPHYIATLGMLPTAEKNALLYGDWDSFSGQVFNEWRNDPEHYDDRKWTHVINPFQIPKSWPIYRGLDWGYAKPFSVGWYAVGPGGVLYRIRELYGCTGEPNTGVKWTPEKCAAKIYEIEHEDPNLKDRYIYGVADSAIFASDTGVPIVEAFEKAQVYFEKGDKQRIPGKMQCHYRLAFDPDGDAMFYVFNTCKHFIRCIPSLVYDETNVEDVDTSQEDHNYDEWRYICMQHVIEPRVNVQPDDKKWTPPPEDPLNNKKKEVYRDPYDIVVRFG